MATEFVQIGNVAFNPAQIVSVDLSDNAGDDQVWVDLVASGQDNNYMLLGGPSARAFKDW